MDSAARLADATQDGRIFRLPREIRDKIFGFAVRADKAVHFTYLAKGLPKWPALLHACRQIRQEALPLYFRLNRFQFSYGLTAPRVPKEITQMWQLEIHLTTVKRSLQFELKFFKRLDIYKFALLWPDDLPLRSYQGGDRSASLEAAQSWMADWSNGIQPAITPDSFKDLLQRLHFAVEGVERIGPADVA